MTAKQREGIIILTNATRTLPLEQRAYLLATAYHETAFTMQPIVEFGGRKYFDKYDTGRLAEALGNTPQADGDGFFFRGRGYVQITGRANYEKAGRKLKFDLVNKPDLLLVFSPALHEAKDIFRNRVLLPLGKLLRRRHAGLS